MPGELGGKLVVITGGGSGIGRACAVLFAREGATVVVADIHGHEDTLNLLDGTAHSACDCDVSSAGCVRELADKIDTIYSRCADGVVHCAGVLGNLAGLTGCTEHVFDTVVK